MKVFVNPGYILHTHDITAGSVEVLRSTRDDKNPQILLDCVGLSVVLRLSESEALKVASGIQAAVSNQEGRTNDI